jgi:hypothetical protein
LSRPGPAAAAFSEHTWTLLGLWTTAKLLSYTFDSKQKQGSAGRNAESHIALDCEIIDIEHKRFVIKFDESQSAARDPVIESDRTVGE